MRRLALLTLAAGFGLSLGWSAQDAGAGEVNVIGAGGNFSVGVTSIKEARYRKVVRQQYDFSCGAAAVATLLSYHYDKPVSEEEVFVAMYNAGDHEKIRKQGFSLLDMKLYLESLDFRANGYRASLDKLAEVGIPAIVLINFRGYLHFVVIKGVTRDKVLVGDPALGMKTIPRDEFEGMWNGILFVVDSEFEVANQHFNDGKEWATRPKAPIGATGLGMRDLAPITLMAPRPNEY